MEVYDLLRSRFFWSVIAVLAVVIGVTALSWPALTLVLLIGLLALGGLVACVVAGFELVVLLTEARDRPGRIRAPEIRITRMPESQATQTPADRR